MPSVRRRRGESGEAWLMRDLFAKCDAARETGVEFLIARADAKQRRQWAARLPDEIAFLEALREEADDA